MNLKKSLSILLFISFIFLIFFCESCSSSKETLNSQGYKNPDIIIVPTINVISKQKKDSTIVLSFYKMMDYDTLKLKRVNVSDEDSLLRLIKIPEIAFRAGIGGIVIIEFRLDSSGTANNIRILSGIGAGVDESVADVIKKFKFNIRQNYQNINTENISILLIAYFRLSETITITPTERTKK